MPEKEMGSREEPFPDVEGFKPEQVPDVALMKRLKEDKEFQKRSFGRELTDEEFGKRFKEGVSLEDYKLISHGNGFDISDEQAKELRSKWVEKVKNRRKEK